MNLFIDTSVIFTDPYWKRNFASVIINWAKEKKVTIFICDVVIEELKENIKKNIQIEIKQIKKSYTSLGQITLREPKFTLPNIEEELKTLGNFFSELFEIENINLLHSSSDDFKEILKRAIKKQKPFAENRNEFKDTVIWITYSKYATKKSLKNCFLLTNNVTDFCKKGNNNELHDDLKEDNDKFKINVSLNEFFKNNNTLLNSYKSSWISSKKLDPKSVELLLIQNEKIRDIVSNKINNEVHNSRGSLSIDNRNGLPQFNSFDVNDYSWDKIINIQINAFKEDAIILGTLQASSLISIYEKSLLINKVLHVEDKEIYFTIEFNFIYTKNDEINNFEINTIEVTDYKKIHGVTI